MAETPPRYGSLIAAGLRRASKEKQLQVEVVEFHGSDPVLKRINTIPVHKAITLAYDNGLFQPPIAPAKSPVIMRWDLPLTVRQSGAMWILI